LGPTSGSGDQSGVNLPKEAVETGALARGLAKRPGGQSRSKEVSMVTTCLEFSVPATPANVGSVRRRVAEAASRAGASGRVVDDIRLCVSEAVANAVLHAYGQTSGTVEVVVELDKGELALLVRDTGNGLARRRTSAEGGYGLQIIEELSRSHSISTIPGKGTEVRMTFELEHSRVSPPDAHN
jgi:stage II sporulation protein AB (anti-sigma F factor)